MDFSFRCSRFLVEAAEADIAGRALDDWVGQQPLLGRVGHSSKNIMEHTLQERVSKCMMVLFQTGKVLMDVDNRSSYRSGRAL